MAAMILRCPTCDSPVLPQHEAHRGLLINATASLRARLLSSKEQLSNMEKKRWSKQFAEQRERDLIVRAMLKEQIERDETLLRQFESAAEVSHG